MTDTGNGRIAVVVLNYNNYADTVECIGLIAGQPNLDIVLVDNCSSNDSGVRLRDRYAGQQGLYFIDSDSNGGYAMGNNLGIRYASEVLRDEYVCAINNDTSPSPDMFHMLANVLDSNPEVGIVGPVILENMPGDIIQSAGADIHMISGKVPARHSGETYHVRDVLEYCDYISGACLMLRGSDLARLGYIPENYFLYFEETEWCLRANRRGLKVACSWDCSLVHKGSATVSGNRGLGSYLCARNRAVFIKRNAAPVQQALFTVFQFMRVLKRRLLNGEDCYWEWAAIKDGLRDRIDPDYSFIFDCRRG